MRSPYEWLLTPDPTNGDTLATSSCRLAVSRPDASCIHFSAVLHLTPHPAWHTFFETLAYFVGYRVYKQSKASRGDIIGNEQRWQVIAAAAVGAVVGSRALGLLEQAPRLHLTWEQVFLPGGGKTIVGGLLGGWLAVEAAKKMAGIHTRTGDLFAIPLCIAIAIGRVGCLLAGLLDDTYGTPTALPWAVDFGDGIPRHPTQAYEILFLAALAGALHLQQSHSHPLNGQVFRTFLFAYLTWRLIIDFIKPQPLVHGLNAIQWSCVAALCWLLISTTRGHLPGVQRATSD